MMRCIHTDIYIYLYTCYTLGGELDSASSTNLLSVWRFVLQVVDFSLITAWRGGDHVDGVCFGSLRFRSHKKVGQTMSHPKHSCKTCCQLGAATWNNHPLSQF